jgi:1-acyl-sn-glycerol-3-phosphate acyltransferase
MILARSLVFYLGLVLSLIPFSVISLFVWPLPYFPRYRIVTLWTHFTLWWLEVTCNLRFRVQGAENIPPGPGIILCKHQSSWETMGLQRVFPPQVWVLKRELLWLPFFGWAINTLDPIFIDRKSIRNAFRQVVKQGTERLKTGRWIVIFPEGTRVAPGEKKRYGVGGGMLAEKTGYPVVPVAHNAGVFWPRRSILKHPGTIDVVVGPVIDPAGKSAAEITALAEEWIEAACDRLPGNRGQGMPSTGSKSIDSVL